MTTSHSPIRLAFRGVVVASVCLAACASSTGEDASTTDTAALAGACGFTVKQNAYDGPGYWGTISVRNGSKAVTGMTVSFDAPGGAHCTNDTVPPGATLSPLTGSGASAHTTSSHCTFTWSNAAFAAGATKTFNYSTDANVSGAASNLTVTYASCTGTPPPPPPPPPPPAGDAGGAGGGGGGGAVDCNSPNLVWRTANKTNFTSYPDPGSEECTKYNGCAYEGEFSACSKTEPLSWVKSHNIVSVFPNLKKASNGIPALALHDLCLKSGSKSIVVTVLDECADSDCSGCCTQNKGGEDELIDIESFTDAKWGVDDGKIQWADLGPTKTQGCN